MPTLAEEMRAIAETTGKEKIIDASGKAFRAVLKAIKRSAQSGKRSLIIFDAPKKRTRYIFADTEMIKQHLITAGFSISNSPTDGDGELIKDAFTVSW